MCILGVRRENDYISMTFVECFINYVIFKLGFGGQGILLDGEGVRIILGRENIMC